MNNMFCKWKELYSVVQKMCNGNVQKVAVCRIWSVRDIYQNVVIKKILSKGVTSKVLGFGPDGTLLSEWTQKVCVHHIPAHIRVLEEYKSWRVWRLSVTLSADWKSRCNLPLSLAVSVVHQMVVEVRMDSLISSQLRSWELGYFWSPQPLPLPLKCWVPSCSDCTTYHL